MITTILQLRNQRAIVLYRRIIGADYRYKQPPSYFFRLWKSYLEHGVTRQYPWDSRIYPEQREADRLMCKTIYQIYAEASGLNVIQLQLDL